ncbi:hypothetical protein [Minwuia thermotolerans]|uniref:Uncharacterized protein n=1 Tax=Minwuia thermotolerans TaxID=2056226 RepID=A0A2M9G1Y6_9PROT|nr:hypothetical protein [Minwuia thermotolerans]PJK29684.1 hypothetical protein CVT23_11615 [Minwuia thermotolerans]
MRWISALLCLLPFAAVAQTVVIEEGRCRLAELHQPAPDVAYQPGVDVHGRPVAPADIGGGSNVTPPSEVSIQLLIPITEFLAVAPPFLGEVEVNAGEVTVDTRTGAIRYRGQRLDAPYAVICDEEAEVTPPPPPARPH